MREVGDIVGKARGLRFSRRAGADIDRGMGRCTRISRLSIREKFEMPMTSRIDVGACGATVTRASAFNEGPKTGSVYITTVSLFDAKTSRTTYAVYRTGRAVEITTDDVVVRDYKDRQNWTIVYARSGTDGDSPAEIRVVQSLAGSELTELKEVKPVSAPDAQYAFRNQIRLRRM